EALRRTRRGITREGMGSGNYALFRCDIDDAQLVFGAGARERNLRAQQQQLDQLQVQRHSLRQQLQALQQLAALLGQIRPLDYAARATVLLDCQRQLREVEQQLSDLDLGAHQDLDDEQQRVSARYQELQHQQVSQRIRQLADQSDSLLERKDQAEQHLLEAAGKLPGMDPQARLEQLDAMLDEAREQFDFAADSAALTSRLHQQAISLERSL